MIIKAADYKVEECRLTEKINKLSEEFGTTDITRMTLLMLLNLGRKYLSAR